MIRFRYHPTLEDYLRLNRMLLWRRLRWLMIFAAGSLLCFLLFPLLLDPLTQGHSVTESYRLVWPLLILPGLVTMLIVATERGARQRWANAPEIRVDRDYEIDEAGLRVTSETFSGSLAWDHLTHAEERRGFFYLSTAQNLFYFFPMALVSDPEALKALVARKVDASPQAAKSRKHRRHIWLVWFAFIIVVIGIVLVPHSWFE
jgi:hypothetical protein